MNSITCRCRQVQELHPDPVQRQLGIELALCHDAGTRNAVHLGPGTMREFERELDESTYCKLSPIVQMDAKGTKPKRARLRNAVTFVTMKDHNGVIPRYCLPNQIHLNIIYP